MEQFSFGVIIDAQPAPEILYQDFEPRELPSGKFRKPDTKPFLGDDGEFWMCNHAGTSLFDKQGVLKAKGWRSFEIPAGTELPESLVIRWTDFNEKFQANHYQIEPRAHMMRVDAYRGALDNLTRAALALTVELAKNEKE